ncbi:MAG: flagellar hook-length control protein FliK, partial [Burkholderiales bacterium]
LTPPYQATPVLDKPPADTVEFGTRLRQAFSQSGLFYEAHQAQWLAGQRTREQLLQEPQGRLPAIAASTVAKAVTAAAVQHDSAPAVADPASPTIARAETARGDAPPAVERLVHKDALPLVQQQLVALDSGQLQWRGEVWPGQTLDWEVGSEPPAGSDAAQTRCWHSRLKLTLPQLGTVTALLALDSHGLRIAVNADSTAAAARLRGGQAALVHAMQRSGLHVGGIEVQTDGHE